VLGESISGLRRLRVRARVCVFGTGEWKEKGQRKNRKVSAVMRQSKLIEDLF
jgi:hypothetical protein